MKVAVRPISRAVMRATYLARRVTSAARTMGIMRVSISHWPGPPDLVVVVLDGHPHRLEVQADLRPRVEEVVLRRDGVVAAVARDRVAATELVALPVRFPRLDAVRGGVDAVLVAHAVEQVELELRPPEAGVAHARGPQELLGPRRERARVVGEGLVRVGLEGRAEEADRRRLPERVEEGGPELGNEDEVARLHRGEAERGAVEAHARLDEGGVEAARGEGHVAPAAPEVAELEVHHRHALVADEGGRLVEGLEHRCHSLPTG